MNITKYLSFSKCRLLLAIGIFGAAFLFGVKTSDAYLDRQLRQKATELWIGMEKSDVLRVFGVPSSEHFAESGAVSLSCYTSDSFGSQDDCGPVGVAFRDDRIKIIFVAGPYPQVIR